MPKSPTSPLTCPVCEAVLAQSGSALTCPAGHSFDVAREGYVNLLLPQGRPITGDSAQMLGVRRAFLEAGHYEPLRSAVLEIARSILASFDAEGPARVLEVGSGEGYYVGGLAAEYANDPRVEFLGVDVSKDAARLAARRYPSVQFFVGDVHRRICVPDASIALVLDVFAPRDPAEFARVLEPGGSVLVAIPAPAHLAELRAQLGLLDIEPDKEARVLERFVADFDLYERRDVEFLLHLDATAAQQLVDMGPNAWHDREPNSATAIDATASFTLLLLRKRSLPA